MTAAKSAVPLETRIMANGSVLASVPFFAWSCRDAGHGPVVFRERGGGEWRRAAVCGVTRCGGLPRRDPGEESAMELHWFMVGTNDQSREYGSHQQDR